MKLFSNDLGIDLGTSNILIYVDGSGIVIREPSVVAVDRNTGKILQVGSAAKNMLGRTPGNVVAMHPLKDGVISDHEMTVKMLQTLFGAVSNASLFAPKPRVVICVPSGVTEVEERTVINAAIEAGARRVYLIEEPLAAALGANLDIAVQPHFRAAERQPGSVDRTAYDLVGVQLSAGHAVGAQVARGEFLRPQVEDISHLGFEIADGDVASEIDLACVDHHALRRQVDGADDAVLAYLQLDLRIDAVQRDLGC